jgi:hypothetical protein
VSVVAYGADLERPQGPCLVPGPDEAVTLWWFSYTGHPTLPAGRAYGLCKSLYYLPIVLYG